MSSSYSPALPSLHCPFVPQLSPHPLLYIPPDLQGTTVDDGGGGGGVLEDGGGGGIVDDGGGEAALELAGVDDSSLVSMICHSASFPLPSLVIILPPYFINGVPLVGGHPFRMLPSALRQVDELATYLSVPGTRETLKYITTPGK